MNIYRYEAAFGATDKTSRAMRQAMDTWQKTEKALRTYQKKAGLTADGLAGKNTFKKLCSG